LCSRYNSGIMIIIIVIVIIIIVIITTIIIAFPTFWARVLVFQWTLQEYLTPVLKSVKSFNQQC